jgi:hypothetical protein
LSYAADDLLLVDSLSGGIVVPAKNPHIGAAFSLHFEKASLLKPIHLISFASEQVLTLIDFRENGLTLSALDGQYTTNLSSFEAEICGASWRSAAVALEIEMPVRGKQEHWKAELFSWGRDGI